MIILESKQVGNISYMFDELDVLESILESNCIRTSSRMEKNPYTNRLERFVSFSRNLTSANSRNPKRWKYGIVLDGNKLSNYYKIVPVSYLGTLSNIGIRIKYLVAYDDNTYVVNFINWNTITISKYVYDILKNYIENIPDNIKRIKHLEHTGEGKRIVNGHKIKEKYLFNNPNGSSPIREKDVPELYNYLIKSTKLNETEERIWCGNSSMLNIKDTIVSVIAPKTLNKAEIEHINNICKEYSIDNILYY